MDTQAFNNQQFGFQQPIAAVATTTETAYTGEQKSQEQNKARFTRAERRAFTKEKRAAQNPKKPFNKKDSKAAPKNCNSVDDVIAYLLTIRGKEGDRKVKESLSRVTKTLEGRITRDAPKKPEPSAKKLEKIQKRKEIRAERRKAKLAARAEHNIQREQGADGVPQTQELQAVTEFEEINFDD